MRTILMLQSVLFVGIHLLFICPTVSSADLIIKLESYIPLEKCEMSFSLFSNGSAKYQGRHCPERSIQIRRRLSIMEVESVQTMINQVQFCELRDKYDANDNNDRFVVSDSETLEITAYCGNTTKSVSVYGIKYILKADLDNNYHTDRVAAQRFDRLHHFVLELLNVK